MQVQRKSLPTDDRMAESAAELQHGFPNAFIELGQSAPNENRPFAALCQMSQTSACWLSASEVIATCACW